MTSGASNLVLKAAESAADYAQFGELCRQYVEWCRARYADMPWFVEEVFGYQALDDELSHLADKYGPPHGWTTLAILNGQTVGGGAVRNLGGEACELKRLYIADSAKGAGVGRALSAALIDQSRAAGYEVMRLDTGNRLTEAIGLYEKLGFEHVAPYRSYPDRLMPFLVFMEKRL